MQKLAKKFAVVAIVAVAAMFVPSEAEAQASVVRISGTCFLNQAGIGFFPCTVQRVVTPSGKVIIWIKGTTNAVPATALHIDNASTGQICSGAAPTFKGVVTPSGNIEIQCRN